MYQIVPSLSSMDAACNEVNRSKDSVLRPTDQWLKYGGTRGNAVPSPTPPVFSPKRSPTSNFQKKRIGTLRRTLRYADMLIVAIIMTVTRIRPTDRHNT